MRQYLKPILLILILFLPLLGCSDESGDDSDTPNIGDDIIGSWTTTDVSAGAGGTWQFFPDGTFIDTQNVTYQYQLQEIDGLIYLAFDRESLNIEFTEDELADLEDTLGQTDFMPIYQAYMPSKDSLVLEPATILYGSDTYFGATFDTYVLRRQ